MLQFHAAKGNLGSWQLSQVEPHLTFHIALLASVTALTVHLLQVSWIRDSGFKGAMIWSLDLDDFTGAFCGEGPYPLIRTVNNVLKGGVPTIPPFT